MNAPLRRELSREEFNKLNLEQQLEYMRELMAHMRIRSQEAKEQLEIAKKTLAKLETKYPTSS